MGQPRPQKHPHRDIGDVDHVSRDDCSGWTGLGGGGAVVSRPDTPPADLPTYHAMPPLGGDNPRPFGAPWAGPLIADELKRADRHANKETK